MPPQLAHTSLSPACAMVLLIWGSPRRSRLGQGSSQGWPVSLAGKTSMVAVDKLKVTAATVPRGHVHDLGSWPGHPTRGCPNSGPHSLGDPLRAAPDGDAPLRVRGTVTGGWDVGGTAHAMARAPATLRQT